MSSSNSSRHSNSSLVARIIMIMTVLTIVVGSIAMISGCIKIINTADGLLKLNWAIQLYNEERTKSNEMTAEAEQWFKERQEFYYNSPDTLVRLYSNQNAYVKGIILALTPVIIIGTLGMDIFYVYYACKVIVEKQEQRSQKHRRGARRRTHHEESRQF